jgi:threonine aldolase
MRMTTTIEERRNTLRRSCRSLHGHGYEPAHLELNRVATWIESEAIDQDVYGEGATLQGFEARVAQLLGYPSARFMPSGSMAQPIALRIWSGREGTKRVGMHPTCHLELHEQRGYSELHELEASLIGPAQRPMLASDLAPVSERLAAVVVELPTRENGGQLPEWAQLVELSEQLRSRGAHPHLDGARLWEAQAHYDRPFKEICELFDSAYVSFYKGIGALSGAMLLGPEDFIREATVWQRRQGGNLYSLLPNWASAAMRLDTRLGRFSIYRQRALELAEALRPIEGLRVIPDPPQVNLCHLWFEISPEAFLEARDVAAEELGIWVPGGARPADPPGSCKIELYVGEGALKLDMEEVVLFFERLISLGRRA